jgi:site-specific recombinase XerD
MVDAGASLPPVRDILGHSSVAITADVYSHPGRSLMSAASSCHTSF